jgi:cytochrome c
MNAIAIALVATICASSVAAAEPLSRLNQRGKAVLTRLCGDCHAVGSTGNSPHVLAPTFRTIENRYDIEDLVEQLRQGFTAPHPDMPTFKFTGPDAQAVRSYLRAIQE